MKINKKLKKHIKKKKGIKLKILKIIKILKKQKQKRLSVVGPNKLGLRA
jgi:hypothetical protein